MKSMEQEIAQLRSDAEVLDDIGAWDDADAKRSLAQVLEAQLPWYDVRAAWQLSVGAAVLGGLLTYAVNGQDPLRAGVASALWLAIGWYSGKVLFDRAPTP